ncbi:hypothetical protein H6P81_021375 [Aristolochia fimbriata]|uniref:Uncharacterized protein n=1 Tax=Aristolochia fimbriata TaxID=158543 RepID=A0AAV7DT25_ARIFI|nr:hypothetical protein H6P81_021375 [Aristolochia fimbriata]
MACPPQPLLARRGKAQAARATLLPNSSFFDLSRLLRDRSVPPSPILICLCGAYGAFVGSPCTGRASGVRIAGAAASGGARWTCASGASGSMSRRPPSSPAFLLHCTDLPRGLVGSLAFPWCLCVFFSRKGQLALMYSPFETRRRPVSSWGYGRAQSAARYFFPPRLVSRRCARTPDARKCSWTHVNAAVPMDLVDSQTKSDRPTFARPPMPPCPVLRRTRIGRC